MSTETLKLVCEGISSDDPSLRLPSALRLGMEMCRSNATPKFASRYVCAEIENTLDVMVPRSWQVNMENFFQDKDFEVQHMPVDYRAIGGRIVGNLIECKLPDGIEMEKSPIFSCDGDKWFCVIGKAKSNRKFTDLLIYERKSGGFVKNIKWLGTNTIGGSGTPRELVGDIQLCFGKDLQTLYVFYAVDNTLAIEIVNVNQGTTKLILISSFPEDEIKSLRSLKVK